MNDSVQFSATDKVGAVLRVLKGESVNQVAERIGVSPRTLRYWRSVFISAGEARLESDHFNDLRSEQEAFLGTSLHHVGIVVPNESRAQEVMTLLGLEESYRGYVKLWQVLCIFTKRRGFSPVEFVIPEGGPLKNFNSGVGGLHHIALAVKSLDEAKSRLEAQGMSFIEEEPVKGAGPFLCNFLKPIYTRGFAVEFVEELKID